jgi:hypothetical protein
MTMSRNERRTANYQQLKQCGFNSKEASVFKDRSKRLIDFICKIKQEGDKEIWQRIEKTLHKREMS